MKKILWGGLTLLIVLAGCDLVSRDFYRGADSFEDPTKGSVVLLLDGATLATKTIAPAGFSMNVATYQLDFTGPTTADDFGQSIGSSGVYSHGALAVGNWTVAVRAYNADATPTLIGALDGVVSATRAFAVTSGTVALVPVSVIPISGTGTLDLRVTWPSAAVAAPSLIASLDPTPGNISSEQPGGFILTPGTPNSDATYLDTGLATGYYALTLRLNDGSSLAWGWMEAVRIVDYTSTQQTTAKVWTLSALTGKLTLTATDNMQNPVAITLNRTPTGDVTQAGGLTATATCVPDPGTYTYAWYLDGVLQVNGATVTGATTASVAFPAGSTLLTVGNHNLSVLVTAGSTLSSETIGFTVVP